jgi:hypothetical protein
MIYFNLFFVKTVALLTINTTSDATDAAAEANDMAFVAVLVVDMAVDEMFHADLSAAT